MFGFEEKWYEQKTKRRQVLQSWKIFDWRGTTTAKKLEELEEMEVAGSEVQWHVLKLDISFCLHFEANC